MGRKGQRSKQIRIELVILVTTHECDITTKEIEEEVSIMCSRLEYRDGGSNHIHIFKQLITGN